MTTIERTSSDRERLLAPLRGRINDMDSHEMTPANKWAESFGDAGALLAELFRGNAEHIDQLNEFGEFCTHVEDDAVPINTDSIWRRSGWEKVGPGAPGAIDMNRRVEVLDFMGVQSQLVFPTFGLIGMILTASPIVWLDSMFGGLPEGLEPEMVRQMGFAVSRAWNSWAIEQQRIDPHRLRMVGVSQTSDLDLALQEIERLADDGVRGVWIPASSPPGGFSPADQRVDHFWRRCAELDMVVYLHLAFEDFTRSSAWGDVPQFAYDTVKSAEYIADPYSMSSQHLVAENYLYTMVLGGVFERHPKLRFGVIECGSHWFGPMAENMDKWARVFRRRMAGVLSMPPSEYLGRNVRVTPFWFEDIPSYVSRFGLEDSYVYGSDYPHIEGGVDQLNTYATMIKDMSPAFAEKFFVTNAELLLPRGEPVTGLRGKAGLVTGAAAGIGRAIAIQLAEQGARVVVADTDIDGGQQTVQAVNEAGGQGVFVRTDAHDVEAMARTTVETFDSLDFAVNNAGIDGPFAPTADYPLDDFDQVVAVNLRGVFLAMRSEIPRMVSGGGGAIVNVASVFGIRGFRNQPAYVASKHGVVGLTRAAALEYATESVRINVVCPGAVRTPMVDRLLADAPEIEAGLTAMHPVGRLGVTDDVCSAVTWLCSTATPFMTGVVMPIDGGWTAG